VGNIFRNHGHAVILHREALPEKSTDAVVCATALAILVAIDGDMKTFAKRFGISQGSTRFARLNIVRLCCNEVMSAKRLEQAMSFVEHEWAISEKKKASRLWVEIGPHSVKEQSVRDF
jgi:hypothetical protein